jgi:hypothetical protein
MVRREPRIAPPAALQPSLPRHIPKLLQKKTKMVPISSTPAQPAASYSQLVTTEKTKMALIRSTLSHSAASYSQLVTAGKNKDGAQKQHSSPACRVIFPNCYKGKQRWRPKEALQLSVDAYIKYDTHIYI